MNEALTLHAANALLTALFAATCIILHRYFGSRRELLWISAALACGAIENILAIFTGTQPGAAVRILLGLGAPVAYLLCTKAMMVHFGVPRSWPAVTIPTLLLSSGSIIAWFTSADYVWRAAPLQVAIALPLLEMSGFLYPRRQQTRYALPIATLALLGAAVFLARIPSYFLLLEPGFTREDVMGSTAFALSMFAVTILIPATMLVFLSSVVGRVMAEYKRRSEHDVLTGLPNRATFEQRYRDAATGGTLVIADLDCFKQVNDLYGHAAGDAAIIAFASLLRQAGVTCGRIGGEEFAILLQRADEQTARVVAEGLRAAWALQAVSHGGGTLRLTASFGLTEFAAGEEYHKAFARADDALYRAKAAGRNRVCVAAAERSSKNLAA